MKTIYLDHCVKRDVREYVQGRGYVVVTALDEGMAEATDDEQVHHATERGWVVLSSNERHFVGCHRRFLVNQWRHSGIITSPERGTPERRLLRVGMLLDWIAAEHPDTRDGLFRWTDLQQLLNDGYILPGFTDEERAIALGRQP